MPFTKVVEECKIYNFPIHTMVHYSSKFRTKTRSKEAWLKWFGTLVLQSVCPCWCRASPCCGSARPTRRGRPLSAGPCAVEPHCPPPFFPTPLTPHVHARRADHPTATPPYCAAPPSQLRAVVRVHHLCSHTTTHCRLRARQVAIDRYKKPQASPTCTLAAAGSVCHHCHYWCPR
jgi:hypothetical protein